MKPLERTTLFRDLLTKALPAIESPSLREDITDFLVTGTWVHNHNYVTYYAPGLDRAVERAFSAFIDVSNPYRPDPLTARRFRTACRDLKRRLPRRHETR